MSRGSIKSDPFAPGNEDTSSISARSDTSIDSHVFDPSFGKLIQEVHLSLLMTEVTLGLCGK